VSAFEVWNDYDPSMRFLTAYPVSAVNGTESSTIAYYVFEPGQHSGLHADDAEEVIYVMSGEGEIFISGRQEKLEAGEFTFVPKGVQHDVYAYGAETMRLLSFFPSARVESTFTEMILPFGDHTMASDMPATPQLQEISYEDLPPELAADMGWVAQAIGLEPGGAAEEEASAEPDAGAEPDEPNKES
jgi:quercetin dioxygenase-like cupin family protein